MQGVQRLGGEGKIRGDPNRWWGGEGLETELKVYRVAESFNLEETEKRRGDKLK